MGKKPGISEDPLKLLCDKLRSKGGVEYRTAVVADERMEYVRGKDLASYFKDKPEAMAAFVSGNKTREEQIEELVLLLLRRRLLLRCDRVYKKPKPGKKRLAKWPRKLVPHAPIEQAWSEESFYVWLYDRPASPWQYVWSLLLVVGVFAVCCFPLAPYWVRLSVVYLSATLLILILGTILIRGLVALVTWLATGRALWIFPNLMDETISIGQAFKPLYSVESDGEAGSLLARLAAAASFGSLIFVLYSFAPESGRMKDTARNAHDAILDWLLAQPNYTAIADAQSNTTDNATTGGTRSEPLQPTPEAAAAAGEATGGDGDKGDKASADKVVPPLEELLAELGEDDEDEGHGAAAGAGESGPGGEAAAADEL